HTTPFRSRQVPVAVGQVGEERDRLGLVVVGVVGVEVDDHVHARARRVADDGLDLGLPPAGVVEVGALGRDAHGDAEDVDVPVVPHPLQRREVLGVGLGLPVQPHAGDAAELDLLAVRVAHAGAADTELPVPLHGGALRGRVGRVGVGCLLAAALAVAGDAVDGDVRDLARGAAGGEAEDLTGLAGGDGPVPSRVGGGEVRAAQRVVGHVPGAAAGDSAGEVPFDGPAVERLARGDADVGLEARAPVVHDVVADLAAFCGAGAL